MKRASVAEVPQKKVAASTSQRPELAPRAGSTRAGVGFDTLVSRPLPVVYDVATKLSTAF